jgi:hypothetical protein
MTPYIVFAGDLDEAIKIAKANPEFEFNEGTCLEVRPVKMKEKATDDVYPTSEGHLKQPDIADGN